MSRCVGLPAQSPIYLAIWTGNEKGSPTAMSMKAAGNKPHNAYEFFKD
jgi:hypothetical protein